MLTEKDYCDYETCVALEELGYPRYHYDNGGELDRILRMVTLYNAQKWLREEKGIGITIFHNYYHDTGGMWYMIELYNTKHWLKTFGEFEEWTQALAEGIKEAVKILKDM